MKPTWKKVYGPPWDYRKKEQREMKQMFMGVDLVKLGTEVTAYVELITAGLQPYQKPMMEIMKVITDAEKEHRKIDEELSTMFHRMHRRHDLKNIPGAILGDGESWVWCCFVCKAVGDAHWDYKGARVRLHSHVKTHESL